MAIYNAAALLYTALGVFVLIRFIEAYRRHARIAHIPTVGPSGMFTSYIGAIKYIAHGKDIIQQGYDQYRGQVFKVPLLHRWQFILSGPELLEDIRRAPDDELSMEDASVDTIQSDYTIGVELKEHPYHIGIVRGPLTRSIQARFPDVQDEIHHAFTDLLASGGLDNSNGLGGEWIRFKTVQSIQKIVCRASNRFFVNTPLCRNDDYLELALDFAIDVFKASLVIGMFPEFFKPLATRLLTNAESNIQRAMRHIGPIIQERVKMDEEHGGKEWAGRPSDLFSWLLNEAPTDAQNIRSLSLRVLAVNAVAIHTTSMGFAFALYQLAAHPELVEGLREEVQAVVKEEGWTKLGLVKMRKLDSFLMESGRLYGVVPTNMQRKTRRDYQFSDGTFVPAGHFVAFASYPEQHDDTNFAGADDFNSARFYDLRMQDPDTASLKHQMITPTTEYTLFGIGRHACPGRFFAVNELKALMGHVILNYDVKFAQERKGCPGPLWFSAFIAPDDTVELMLRKRQTTA